MVGLRPAIQPPRPPPPAARWLRYDKAMEDLTNPATRPRAETEADELIADMEDVLDYEEGRPGRWLGSSTPAQR